MLDGVVITPLKVIEDDRGKVMHFLRSDWDVFKDFGEVYFSTVKFGKVKGWRKHTVMIQNLVCVSGELKLALYDDRDNSQTAGQTAEIVFGDKNYILVTIPPGIWSSSKSLVGESILANCSSIRHDPAESVVLPVGTELIPYNWEL